MVEMERVLSKLDLKNLNQHGILHLQLVVFFVGFQKKLKNLFIRAIIITWWNAQIIGSHVVKCGK